MTVSVKHKFACGVPDGADATVVRPSNWNDAFLHAERVLRAFEEEEEDFAALILLALH